MDKITINELKGYLGTGLQMRYLLSDVITLSESQKDEIRTVTLTNDNVVFCLKNCKPLLYPLSSLTEYREDLGFVPIEELNRLFLHKLAKLEYYNSDLCNGAILLSTIISGFNILSIKEKLDLLYSWHIDVHNLIDRNLAINIKTLKDE
jgi:hypothetical protein